MPDFRGPSKYRSAAIYWFNFGFSVIPVIPGTKRTAVLWNQWLKNLSRASINRYWLQHPHHEVGFIVGNEHIVFDADAPQAISALVAIEARFDLKSMLVVKTNKGVHHYYRLAAGSIAKSDSHCTAQYPERIDVKTGRAMVMLPPSSGRSILAMEGCMQAEYGRDLTEADQVFIDAIFAHNGRQPSRLPGTLIATCANPKIGNLRLLRSVLALLDADFGYDDWLRVAAGVFNETGGSAEGLELFDSWSSGGIKYKGPCEIRSKWNSFHLDHPRPVTMATLRRMVEAKGYDWLEVCAAAEDGFDDIADDTEGVA